MSATKPTPQQTLAYALLEARSDVDHQRKRVISESRAIADRLTALADRLDADPTYTVNALGELQSRGPGFDVLVTTLDAKRTAVERLAYLYQRVTGEPAPEGDQLARIAFAS